MVSGDSGGVTGVVTSAGYIAVLIEESVSTVDFDVRSRWR